VAVFDVIQLVGHAVEGMAVWRYLFSPAYRATVHERWRGQSRFETAMEIVAFTLSFFFVIAIVVGALGWLASSAIR
jgi:hypothetical protein